jgi:hypothetical protein
MPQGIAGDIQRKGRMLMKVKIQHCWCGGDKFVWRALVAGGLRIPSDGSYEWTRKTATEMLDVLEAEGFDRRSIRFLHV